MSNKTQLVIISDSSATINITPYSCSCVPFNLIEEDLAESKSDSPDTVIGIIPVTMVSSFVREIAPKQKKYTEKIIPFLLEEDLISPLETQHIAIQKYTSDTVRAIVIDKNRMQNIIDMCTDKGLFLSHLYVDADLITLQPEDKAKTVYITDHYLLKTQEGLVAQINHLDDLDEKTEINCDVIEKVENYAQFFAAKICAPKLSDKPPINLLQGAYQPQVTNEQRSKVAHKLLFFCATLLTLQSVYWAMVGADFQQRKDILQQQSLALYQTYFPDDKKIVDIRRQAEGHLNQLADNAAEPIFFSALEQLDESIKANFSPNVITVKSIHYNRQTADFVLDLQAPTVESVELLKKAVEKKSQFVINIEQVTQQSDITENNTIAISRLRIERRSNEVKN